jgi:hypothetical protein
MSKQAWIAVMAIGVLALGVVGAAYGGGKKHPSSVVITDYKVDLHGNLIVKDLVASPRQGCIGGRTVILYRERPDRPDELVGEDRTDENGRSKIEIGQPESGTYYERLESNRKCKGGTSQDIEVSSVL